MFQVYVSWLQLQYTNISELCFLYELMIFAQTTHVDWFLLHWLIYQVTMVTQFNNYLLFTSSFCGSLSSTVELVTVHSAVPTVELSTALLFQYLCWHLTICCNCTKCCLCYLGITIDIISTYFIIHHIRVSTIYFTTLACFEFDFTQVHILCCLPSNNIVIHREKHLD